MKQYLRLFYSGEGQGNIGYDFPAASAAGVVNAANDGLSKDLATGKIAQLGQAVGRAGDPAVLTEDREIPNPGAFTVFFGKNDGISDVVGINSSAGIAINNAAGTFEFFTGFGRNYQLFTTATGILIWQLNSAADNLTYDKDGVAAAVAQLSFSRVFKSVGLKEPVTAIAGTPFTVLATGCFHTIDSSGGNIVVNLNPAVLNGSILDFKKISADVNTITLTPTSGTIQGLGAAAATFVFSGQGQSVSVRCNGTNFFIV